jgi:hypothetical protein
MTDREKLWQEVRVTLASLESYFATQEEAKNRGQNYRPSPMLDQVHRGQEAADALWLGETPA